MQRILFLTGRLAEPALRAMLERLAPGRFEWEVSQLGVQVAALMTADLIRRRLAPPRGFDFIMVPGRCRGDLEALSAGLGLPVRRGHEDIADLPEHFGEEKRNRDLSRYSVKIFAEIVDAPRLSVEAIARRARELAADGADVIDLGCLPETPFPHLEEAVAEMKRLGHAVSVDSVDESELLRATRCGADYLLSLTEHTLHVADAGAAVPVLIPARRGSYASLERAVRAMRKRGRPFLADPILEPIHFGLADSLPELTDADTSGINALLFGLASELGIDAVLATSVSGHACAAVREADLARRLMHAAREEGALPRGFGGGLMTVHDKRPWPQALEEIRAVAARVRDPSFRIQTSAEGVHVFNRDGFWSAADPYQVFPHLGLERDGAHAFYMGVEMARAEIAWRLGKRYVQDTPLDWCVADLRGRAEKEDACP